MAIIGKLVGALIGSLAGPGGTILGGLLGHLYDRAQEEHSVFKRFRPFAADASGEGFPPVQLAFFSSLIGLSIAVAGSAGRVKVAHVDALKGFLREHFALPEETHRTLHRLIDEAVLRRDSGTLDMEALCAYFRSTSTLSGRVLLLRLLVKIAAADSRGLEAGERELIQRIAARLGIGGPLFQSIQAELGRRPERSAYHLLGVREDAPEAEIRKAYRRLVAQSHPDKVASLGEEFVREAEERLKRINQAYEEIRKKRGWS